MSPSRYDTAYRIVFAAGALGAGWWLGGPVGIMAIEVLEGDDGYRWLRVSDLRRTLRDLPKDATLNLIEPERTEFDESGKQLAMRADALLQWLNKAHTDEHIRFKVWVERSIHHPSLAQRREREKKAVQGPVV